MNTLPAELHVQILGYCTWKEQETLAKVCTQWHQIVTTSPRFQGRRYRSPYAYEANNPYEDWPSDWYEEDEVNHFNAMSYAYSRDDPFHQTPSHYAHKYITYFNFIQLNFEPPDPNTWKVELKGIKRGNTFQGRWTLHDDDEIPAEMISEDIRIARGKGYKYVGRYKVLYPETDGSQRSTNEGEDDTETEFLIISPEEAENDPDFKTSNLINDPDYDPRKLLVLEDITDSAFVDCDPLVCPLLSSHNVKKFMDRFVVEIDSHWEIPLEREDFRRKFHRFSQAFPKAKNLAARGAPMRKIFESMKEFIEADDGWIWRFFVDEKMPLKKIPTDRFAVRIWCTQPYSIIYMRLRSGRHARTL